jgi:hypothetical protein
MLRLDGPSRIVDRERDQPAEPDDWTCTNPACPMRRQVHNCRLLSAVTAPDSGGARPRLVGVEPREQNRLT